MTVPLDVRNDIRSMDADGVPRAEIAKRLRVSRNTVAKYADMEDMSPEPPLPERRRRPALEGHETWVESVLEADLGAPRKQRHTAKRVFDRLVCVLSISFERKSHLVLSRFRIGAQGPSAPRRPSGRA